MIRNPLADVTPYAIYKINDVFNAVSLYADQVREQKQTLTEDWQAKWPPSLQMIEQLQKNLENWRSRGFTHVAAAAPFSDGTVDGKAKDSVISQMMDGRIAPTSDPRIPSYIYHNK